MIFDIANRHALALEILRGNDDAYVLISDLLEEEGACDLAKLARAPSWTRPLRQKAERDLDFVLAILPYRVDLRLACDFFRHATERPIPRATNRYAKEVNELLRELGVVREGSLTPQTIAKLGRKCRIVSSRWSVHLSQFAGAPYDMEIIAKSAYETMWRETEREGTHEKHATATIDLARRIAVISREIAQHIECGPNPSSREAVNSKKKELSWQIAQVRRLLMQVLTESKP